MRPIPPQLDRIIDELDRLDEEFMEGTRSTHYLSVEKSGGDVLSIKGNVEGLIQLAKQILGVVAKGTSGAHFHLDEAGMADRCDTPVAFVLEAAPWEQSPS